jgi:omega-6 fatty acid desaturase (delta-12 desaturase)
MVTPPRDVRMLIRTLPPACYANPTWRGLAYLIRDLAMFAGVSALLLAVDRVALLPVLWVAGGLAIGALFVLGHDAAHGALFRSRRLAYWTAQLALLPSLHAYEVWVLGHNRVHHGHTGRAGIDFVWHPLTPAQYARLGRLARLLHHLEWSAWGAGLYYLRVMWWQRMMRVAPPPRLQRAFRRDRRRVWTYLALATAALVSAGWLRTGSVGGAVWVWAKVLLAPWLVWNWLIGATVHVHHIGPDGPWEPRALGRGSIDPLVGATSHVIPAWLNVFWHNIFLHTAHHVDPRIPFYRLPLATAVLARETGGALAVRPLRLRAWLAATRRCKLYDFERGCWTGYAVATAAPRREGDAGSTRPRCTEDTLAGAGPMVPEQRQGVPAIS